MSQSQSHRQNLSPTQKPKFWALQGEHHDASCHHVKPHNPSSPERAVQPASPKSAGRNSETSWNCRQSVWIRSLGDDGSIAGSISQVLEYWHCMNIQCNPDHWPIARSDKPWKRAFLARVRLIGRSSALCYLKWYQCNTIGYCTETVKNALRL